MAARTAELLDRLQVGLPDMSNQVGLLSGGQRQAVAVARAAAFASNVVILDEPTAALGLRELHDACPSTSSTGCASGITP